MGKKYRITENEGQGEIIGGKIRYYGFFGFPY
jgi:hypothetical protein